MSDLTDDELEMATARHVSFAPSDVLREASMLQRAAIEIRRHRAMVKRLEEWRDQLCAHSEPGSVGPFIGLELGNRMRGK